MGEDPETKEKMLVKSNDEFTSLIGKIYKVQEDFIIITAFWQSCEFAKSEDKFQDGRFV